MGPSKKLKINIFKSKIQIVCRDHLLKLIQNHKESRTLQNNNIAVFRNLHALGYPKAKTIFSFSCHNLHIFNLIFSESTCSGVSKISKPFVIQSDLGQQVPQHDVCPSSRCVHNVLAAKNILTLAVKDGINVQ
jgi:hypothetical protein